VQASIRLHRVILIKGRGIQKRSRQTGRNNATMGQVVRKGHLVWSEPVVCIGRFRPSRYREINFPRAFRVAFALHYEFTSVTGNSKGAGFGSNRNEFMPEAIRSPVGSLRSSVPLPPGKPRSSEWNIYRRQYGLAAGLTSNDLASKPLRVRCSSRLAEGVSGRFHLLHTLLSHCRIAYALGLYV
jgi:hypothetical protein